MNRPPGRPSDHLLRVILGAAVFGAGRFGAMSKWIAPKLASWAVDLDDNTIAQASRTARLPVVDGHVALMPDAHVGFGATIGSVIPTRNAIIPSAVGVDIGCGMIAVETTLGESQLPDTLTPMMRDIERAIPAGVGSAHAGPAEGSSARRSAHAWLGENRPATELDEQRVAQAMSQMGTLGSGNHFVEVCIDERGVVWVVLHSGSRGIGNRLAQRHIDLARRSGITMLDGSPLEDPDLAWFVQGTDAFDAYVTDMLWAQDYAMLNREVMMDAALEAVFDACGTGREVDRINCHHNFAANERHLGKELWITRKGAIRARRGDRGVIPGSMGTSTFVVQGRGNDQSWSSCSHGAGRSMSRTAAKKRFNASELARQMGDRTWLADRANALVDEIPSAYKDIETVMAAQADLVTVVHTLRQVLNYKGV